MGDDWFSELHKKKEACAKEFPTFPQYPPESHGSENLWKGREWEPNKKKKGQWLKVRCEEVWATGFGL